MTIRFNEGFADGAAFADGAYEYEMARILRRIADEVEGGASCGVMHDVNGNRVGEWQRGWADRTIRASLERRD